MQPKPRANARGILYFALGFFSGLYNDADPMLPEGTYGKAGQGTAGAEISLAWTRVTLCMHEKYITSDFPGWNLAV